MIDALHPKVLERYDEYINDVNKEIESILVEYFKSKNINVEFEVNNGNNIQGKA